MCEVQRQWGREFSSEPPIRVTISRIPVKFETDSTVQDVYKQRSGGSRLSTSGENSAVVLQLFTRSAKWSVRRCAREPGISRARVHRVLKTAKWKCYVPSLLHAMVEDDPGRRTEFC
jgi:hypothetical protein